MYTNHFHLETITAAVVAVCGGKLLVQLLWYTYNLEKPAYSHQTSTPGHVTFKEHSPYVLVTDLTDMFLLVMKES